MANNKCIKSRSKYSFVNFMTDIITQLHKNGQHKTWQHYRATLNSFMRFRQNKDLSLRKMDAAMMEAYEAYLKQQDVCRNTSSFYMRILRAVYNRAVEQELIAQQYPFRRVYTGIDKTRKRAIPFETVKLIKQLDLQQSPSSDMAKDAFMMSFYLRGISFIDLAHLKKSDLQDGYLHYNRSKTHQRITVKWEPQMQALVDKYKHLTDNSSYLFPFLHDNSDEENPDYQLYHNAESRITYHLKKLKQQLGIQGNLTLYVARHSWATAAKEHHQPISVISEALGHDSETTTQIYLRSIQTSEVDKLNAELLSELI
jgi:integrase